jgi:hypothetical protein
VNPGAREGSNDKKTTTNGEENGNSYVHVGHDLIFILFSKRVGIKDIKLLNIKYLRSVMA